MKKRQNPGDSEIAEVPDIATAPVRLPDDGLTGEHTLTLEEYLEQQGYTNKGDK